MDTETREIVSSPSFRLISTLRYILFHPLDLDQSSSSIQAWQTRHSTNLQFHSQRLQDAARAFQWTNVADQLQQGGPALLEQHLQQAARAQTKHKPSTDPQPGTFHPFRSRLEVSSTGTINVTITPMLSECPSLSLLDREISLFNPPSSTSAPDTQPPSSSSSADTSTITIDTQPTPTSLFTTHKTNHRTPYDAARARKPNLTPSTPPTTAEVLLFNDAGEITEASFSTVYFWRAGRWVTPRASCGANLGVTRRYALQAGFCIEAVVLKNGKGGDGQWEVEDGEVVWLSNAVRGFFMGRVSLS